MLVNVRVVTQVFENKAFADGGENYRPKGSQVFNMPIDSDVVMYAHSLVTAIEEVLKGLGNDLYTYEYLEHDVEFKDAITLPEQTLTEALMILQ
jgi:hypothetical protein